MSAAIPDEDRRDTWALITAVHAQDGATMVSLLLELSAANRLAGVLFSTTAHYVGLIRTLAPLLGVSTEYLIQSAALRAEDPPA